MRRRTLLLNPTLIHDNNAIAHKPHHTQIVGNTSCGDYDY
jgi:hypothetical protein